MNEEAIARIWPQRHGRGGGTVLRDVRFIASLDNAAATGWSDGWRLCKAAVLSAAINGTPWTTQYENHKNYSRLNL